MKEVCGVGGTGTAAVAGSRAVIVSHQGQSEEPRGTNGCSAKSVSQKSLNKGWLSQKIQCVSREQRDGVDNLAVVLNIISPQEAEGWEEILTDMFSYYILMTKSIPRWAISS